MGRYTKPLETEASLMIPGLECNASNMLEYVRNNMLKYVRFSLKRIFLYKDRVIYSVLIRENLGQRKPFSDMFYAVMKKRVITEKLHK